MLRSIARDQTRLGMYIHGFKGSWFKHPFWRTRFVLTDPEDLTLLLDSDVEIVVIDIAKGLDISPDMATPLSRPSSPATPRQKSVRLAADKDQTQQAARDHAMDDRARATAVMKRSGKVMKQIFDHARLGKALRAADVRSVIEDISESVWRNAHALIGVTRLKSKDEYTYLHSVAVCALMINLARYLALDEAVVKDLGMAGLLHDIGKMAVPSPILNKPDRLSDDEFALVRSHPEKGHALLTESIGVPDMALDVCRHHHERMDGTGYPHRLKGPDISLAARMGAICDVYDALTSNRIYKKAWTPGEAIAAMASWDGHFDTELLFKFMQSISVFPAGMLVRLRSNQLAVVMPNGRRASRPRVKAFYDTRANAQIDPVEIVITDTLAGDQIVSKEQPGYWNLPDWPALCEGMIGPPAALAA